MCSLLIQRETALHTAAVGPRVPIPSRVSPALHWPTSFLPSGHVLQSEPSPIRPGPKEHSASPAPSCALGATMSFREDTASADSPPSSAGTATPSASALGAFAHLPAYEFDFDYRGDSIRHAAVPEPPQPMEPRTYTPTVVDDFDSYMFPDADYPAADPAQLAAYHSAHPLYDSSASSIANPRPSVATPVSRHAQSSAKGTASQSGAPADVDWHAVDASQLFLPDGSGMEPDKLYTGYTKHVVLVFVPRQAVELAGLVYGKIAHLLQQSGARLVFVTAWAPAQARTFLSRFERVSPFPGALVCDPNATLFGAFGFTRSPLRALFSSSKISAPMRQGVRNAFSTVSYRAQNRDIASTPVSSKRLKCGAAVLPSLRGYAKRPVLTYLNDEAPSTGIGCYLDVLSACGVNEAFVPEIDVAQVYARFNSMRVTSIKARTADEKEANRLKAQKHRGSRQRDKGRNALKGT